MKNTENKRIDEGLVSVIIPVYNVSRYVRQCIDSVICQSYPNLEIIIIDDGSSDNSGTICEEYAVNDDRISVYHTENQGLSAAKMSNADIIVCGYWLEWINHKQLSANNEMVTQNL